MREGKNRLQIGALFLGVGLALGVAAPALADDPATVPGVSWDGDENALTIETDDYIVTADDPSSISGPETRTDRQIFTDDLLDCIADIGVSDAITGTLENVLDEEEVTTTDPTEFNPYDTEGDFDERVFDCDATPPL